MTSVEVDPHTVIVSRWAGSPFAGMTISQARLMNSALAGLPVEVYGGKSWGTAGPAVGVYIFGGMLVPGYWKRTPFEEAGDLTLYESERVADCYLPRPGLSRVLSATLVERFDVLAIEPQFRYCETCGKRMPLTEKVYDTASLGNAKLPPGTYGEEEPFEWAHRFECHDCWWSF